MAVDETMLKDASKKGGDEMPPVPEALARYLLKLFPSAHGQVRPVMDQSDWQKAQYAHGQHEVARFLAKKAGLDID